MVNADAAAPSGLWESILSFVERKIGGRACRTWISPARVRSLDLGVLKLSVPNEFFVDWLSEHYSRVLHEAASDALGRPVKVEICSDGRAEQCGGSCNGSWQGDNGGARSAGEIPAPQTTAAPSAPQVERGRGSLNPSYTFDSFVVAGSNQLATAACLAVVERLGAAYNPLFIYGGTGLGKTHMLHAIGHAALGKDHMDGVCYLSAERFMNEMIASIQQGTTLAFRNKYRRARLLLIDDVHFLAGKESTQEEFFHTFNSLHEAGRQIVLTSDRPPKEIPRIEDRLISRFTWGLVADIQKPDLETRVAILQKKAAQQRFNLNPEVALAIARIANGNIRELEGSLLRLKAHSQLAGRALTLELVAEALEDILRPRKQPATVLDVQLVVAKHFHLRAQDLCGRKRTNCVAFPRQVAMYLCRSHLDAPLAEIGEKFGGRDHTTVIYACSRIETMLKSDPALRKVVDTLSGKVLEEGGTVLTN